MTPDLANAQASGEKRRASSPRRAFILAVKIAISAGLIWLILSKVEFGDLRARLFSPHVAPLVGAFAVALLQVVVVTWRFRRIVTAIGQSIGFAAALVIGIIGIFFNQSLPSTIGGDAVRIWRLARAGMPLGGAVNSVLLDRITALIAILLMIAVSLPALISMANNKAPVYAFATVALAGVLSAALVIAVGKLPAPLLRFRMFGALQGLLADLRRLVMHPPVAVPVLGAAIVNHALTAAVVFGLAVAYEAPIGLWACLVLVPPVMLVAVVPISIAGWGVREGAMITAFGLIGITAGDALVVSVAFGIVNILLGLPGGLVFLVTNGKSKRKQN